MIGKLFRSVREYRRDSLLAPLFVCLEVVIEVLIPFFMDSIIDVGMGDMAHILKIGTVLVFAALLSLLFGALSGKYAALASAGFAANLRSDLFYHIQDFSFSNIDRFSTASLVTRLTTDVTNVQNAYQMVIRILVRGPLMLVFALVMAMGISFELSVVFFAAIPVLGAGLFWIVIRAHPHFEKVFRQYDQLNSVVQENVTAVRTVKSYVREEHECKKFCRISDRVYHLFSDAEKVVAMSSPLMQFSMYTCILLLSWLGARLIVSSSMTTGQLMSMIVYATQILSSLIILSMVFVMIIMAEASARRIVEVLDERSSLQNPALPASEVPDGSIDFEGVDFGYGGGTQVLRGVTLHIAPGETVGIIGATGSAKTTLVQLIPRLYDVTAGCVRVGGKDVRDYSLAALRNQVAMVLQQNLLFSGTIRENLRWGNKDADDGELISACGLAQADSFIRSLPGGYDTVLEQGGTNLSGGQKQRLCIARALLKKPKILILDDSTSAVDTRTDALIRKAFREELPDTTKLIIAQRISSVADADRVVVLDGGRVDATGTPAELYASNAIYREICISQGKGEEDNDA